MNVIDRIRVVMRGATVEEFAELIGENTQRVKDVLRNKTKPPVDMLVAVRQKLGVDLNWLAAGEGPGGQMLSVKQGILLERYSKLGPQSQAAVDAMCLAISSAPGTIADTPESGINKPSFNQNFHANVGQVIDGSQSIAGDLRMDLGGTSKASTKRRPKD